MLSSFFIFLSYLYLLKAAPSGQVSCPEEQAYLLKD